MGISQKRVEIYVGFRKNVWKYKGDFAKTQNVFYVRYVFYVLQFQDCVNCILLVCW